MHPSHNILRSSVAGDFSREERVKGHIWHFTE